MSWGAIVWRGVPPRVIAPFLNAQSIDQLLDNYLHGCILAPVESDIRWHGGRLAGGLHVTVEAADMGFSQGAGFVAAALFDGR